MEAAHSSRWSIYKRSAYEETGIKHAPFSDEQLMEGSAEFQERLEEAAEPELDGEDVASDELVGYFFLTH